MDRVIGGVLGLSAFIAVIVLSILRGIPFRDCLVRAAVACAVGYLVGWMVFGKLGLSIAKEAAGKAPAPSPMPAAPAEQKPAPPKTT